MQHSKSGVRDTHSLTHSHTRTHSHTLTHTQFFSQTLSLSHTHTQIRGHTVLELADHAPDKHVVLGNLIDGLRFGFRTSGFGFWLAGVGCRVPCSGFGFRVSGIEIRVSGFDYRVPGFGSRVYQLALVAGHHILVRLEANDRLLDPEEQRLRPVRGAHSLSMWRRFAKPVVLAFYFQGESCQKIRLLPSC